MKLKNKKALVYGLSNSGKWASLLLQKHRAQVFLFDDDLTKLRNKNIKNCYLIQELNEKIIQDLDFIIVSPAIEKDNTYLQLAKQYNIKVFSELEFASMFCKNLVAITGTNGKTTTTELVAKLINTKRNAVACGNIGYSLSQAVIENKNAIKVAEVSSFMLENSNSFTPHVATVLNIQPDHLIRHKTMEEYTSLKLSIFKNLKPSNYAVVNLDDKIKPNNVCKIVTYSYSKPANVNVIGGYICLNGKPVVAINNLKIKGKHNIYNVMCAICFAYIYNVKPEKMKQVLQNFTLSRFRIENVGKVKGINFINDSKSTNIASTLACVESIKGSIILLLCGSKKMLDYSFLLSSLPKRVKQIIVFGEISDEFENINTTFKLAKFNNMADAFEYAVNVALKNDNIVLSPSSASYDQFSNYIERGEAFNDLVKNYEQNKEK